MGFINLNWALLTHCFKSSKITLLQARFYCVVKNHICNCREKDSNLSEWYSEPGRVYARTEFSTV